jgi:hypothetical protein
MGALGLLLATAGGAYAQAPVAFAPVATYSAGGSTPRRIVVADVNGDGQPDLVVANNTDSAAGVLLGTGNGLFGAAATFSTGLNSFPSAVAVADVNGDGRPDLLTANTNSTAGVLLGTGTGSFGPATTFSTGSNGYPSAIAVADVNGDGQPDLLVTNQNRHNVGVLLGTGTGAFGPVATFSTGLGSSPIALVVADVNGDGRPDVLTANQATNAVGVLLGLGNGTFQAVATYSTGSNSAPYNLAVADVSGDGRPDLLVANPGSNAVGVLLGTGSGSFGAITTFSTGSGSFPTGVAVADANGDGRPDLLVSDFYNGAAVLPGTGNGAFGAATTYGTGTNSYPTSLAAADVNGDGQPDLLTANEGNGTIGVLLNASAAKPALTGLSPASGPVGTRVTITGTNLGGATSVSFNGTAASSFVVNSATSITAVVAAGTTTGPVRVSTPGGTATSATSFVVRVVPTTVADSYSTPQGVMLSGNVLTNDLGTNPRAILINRPANGTLVLNPDGSFSYRPNAGFVGTDSFTYYACDQGTPLLCGDPATATITVTRVAPTTVADSYTTPQGVTLTGNVLTNDIGTNPRAILINRPTRGTLVLNPDGSFSYQPNAGFSGSDSFSYYACNMGAPLVCGEPATVSLTVTPASTATRPAAPAGDASPATPAKPAAPAVGGATIALELALTGHPNPFADELQLSFALPIAQAYTLAVYDAQGRLVQQLARGQAEADQAQQLKVPTHTYAAGLYFVRLTTSTGTRQLKLSKQ